MKTYLVRALGHDPESPLVLRDRHDRPSRLPSRPGLPIRPVGLDVELPSLHRPFKTKKQRRPKSVMNAYRSGFRHFQRNRLQRCVTEFCNTGSEQTHARYLATFSNLPTPNPPSTRSNT